ncbi:hypothetical protein CRYUN_Cryun17cG0063700 [Craigia yunnanensis]
MTGMDQYQVGRPYEKLHQEEEPLESPHCSTPRKTVNCLIENCNREFAFQSNMKRPVKEFHDEDSSSSEAGSQKQCVSQELGCGKVFKFASKLRKHKDAHVKLDLVEAFCPEPSCMKYFTNEQCLKAHVQSCHLYINYQICEAK